MDSAGKKVAIKFLMPNSLTGSLIGSGGKAIKELIAISEAKINVSSNADTYPGTSERVVLISGVKEAVGIAQTLLWEMIGLMTKNSGGDLRLVEWNPRATQEELGKNNNVEVSGKFTIPALAGGAILGKGGDTIRSFSTDSGARISMSGKDEALFTQERIISVSGTVGACVACTNLVIAKLAEQPEPVPFVNRGTTYSSPLTNTLGLLGSAADGKQRGRGAPRDGTRRPGRGGGRGEEGDVKADAAGAPIADTTITLSVPDELVGNIFGRQGATMREIISLSGAKIVVSGRGEYVEGTTNRVVTITGSPTAAQTAHLFITQRLHTPSNPPPRRTPK